MQRAFRGLGVAGLLASSTAAAQGSSSTPPRPTPRSAASSRDSTADSTRAPHTLSTVVIAPGVYGMLSPTAGAAHALSRDQIRVRPQLGEDLFRSVNRLPGIASNDYSAALHVRGARADELLVTFDGLELHEPFHLKDVDNALSVIDIETVGTMDLTASGFTAERGDRLGSLLAVRSAEPAGDRPRESVGLSVTNLRAGSQGGFAGGRGAWLASARRGYLDLALRLAGAPDSISPRYDDAFAKVSFDVDAKNRVSAEALHAGDTMTLLTSDLTLRSSYGSDYVWATWEAHPGENLAVTTMVSFTTLGWRRDGASLSSSRPADPMHDVRRFDATGARQEWSLESSERLVLRWGAEAQREHATYDYDGVHSTAVVRNGTRTTDTVRVRASLAPSGTRWSAWFSPRAQPVKWLVAELGVRYDAASVSGDGVASPRANVSIDLGSRTTLRAALGRYAQPQPIYALDVQDGVTTFAPADLAEHRVIGLERQFEFANVRVEAYERRVFRQRARFVNLASRTEFFPEDEPDRVRLDATRASARGVEVSARRDVTSGLGWSVGYSLSSATDDVAGQALPRLFDQRHAGLVDATWRPKGGTWRVSAAWQVHSGWPEAPVTFEVDTVRNSRGVASTTVITRYGPVGALGANRLAWYHRTDLRVSREFTLARGRISAFADLFNVFGDTNVRSWDYHTSVSAGRLSVRRDAEPWLGRLPSAGVSWEF